MVRITPATTADLAYIVSLHARLAEYLGWIPRDGISEHIDCGHVLLAWDGPSPVGYVIRGVPRLFAQRIFQLAIEPCEQRRLIGTALAEEAGPCEQLLHCRDGIPANIFWREIGFRLVEVRLGGAKRRKMVNIWLRPAKTVSR